MINAWLYRLIVALERKVLLNEVVRSAEMEADGHERRERALSRLAVLDREAKR
jgi:hypothetical protein